jgi:hypothetical protein
VVEIKNLVIPIYLILKTALPFGTMTCPAYKRELLHIPHDCNYIQGEYLEPQKLIYNLFLYLYIVASLRGRIVDIAPGEEVGFELRSRLGRRSAVYSNKPFVQGT